MCELQETKSRPLNSFSTGRSPWPVAIGLAIGLRWKFIDCQQLRPSKTSFSHCQVKQEMNRFFQILGRILVSYWSSWNSKPNSANWNLKWVKAMIFAQCIDLIWFDLPGGSLAAPLLPYCSFMCSSSSTSLRSLLRLDRTLFTRASHFCCGPVRFFALVGSGCRRVSENSLGPKTKHLHYL